MKTLAIRSMCLVMLTTGIAIAHEHGAHSERAPAAPGACVSADVCLQRSTIDLLSAHAGAKSGEAVQLHFQRSEDAAKTWSAPVRIGADQPPTIAHRGMDAQIAASGDRLIAAWPAPGDDHMGRGPMELALSSDGGKTWRPGKRPSEPDATSGQSFIDVAADARGVFHLVWLDSQGEDGKGLRYAQSRDGGQTWSQVRTLDPTTCECCWNSIAIGSGGKVAVLYRNRDPRDMAVVRSDDGGATWSQPVTVGRFDWAIGACPHVGGGLAFSDDGSLHAVVWSGQARHVGVYALSSPDGGSRWLAPQRLGGVDATRPTLAIRSDGALVATWDAFTGGTQAIFAAESFDSGKTWRPAQRLSDPGVSAMHPQVFTVGNETRVLWTQSATGKPATWVVKAIPSLVHEANRN
jgi:hypothetical protein